MNLTKSSLEHTKCNGLIDNLEVSSPAKNPEERC